MSNADIKLVGAMDDSRGLSIAVHQDHDGIRIDVAGAEIMLSAEAADRLSTLLLAAVITADLWSRSNG